MKYLLLIITLLLSSPSWGETVSMDDLVERNDLYYKKFTDTPFTGEVSGQGNGYIENGKKDGYWVTYHENGQLKAKGTFKDEKWDGLWEWYYDNGRLAKKGTYKDGVKQE